MNWLTRWFRKKTTAPRGPTWLSGPLWDETVQHHAFLRALSADEARRLHVLCAGFLETKTISPAGGLTFDHAMAASIAAQACLPVLELGLGAYPDFSEIIVYPGEFVVDRSVVDDAGVVHEYADTLSGEAWEGGPVVLSWADASGSASDPANDDGGNVVIHEFAHKLDMANGEVDGIPRFFRALHADLDVRHWCAVLDACYDDFAARVEQVELSVPHHIDPESEAAGPWYAALPLDAYAASDPAEFFSVASEVFFIAPHRLHAAYPELYEQLRLYYRQDPLRRSAPPRS